MPVVISMLRGVNVGGHNKVDMSTLREICAELGLEQPRTWIQSGNVVFKTSAKNLGTLARRIESGIEGRFGFRPSVILRTALEMRSVIAANPFASRSDIDPSKLAVLFLAEEPGTDVRKKVLAIKADPEEIRMAARELYIYFPNGMGRPRLSIPVLERTLRTPSTGRNWNTVNKLSAIAEELSAIRP